MDHTRQLYQLEGKIRRERDETLKYIYLHQLADLSRKEGKLAYALQRYEDALVVAQTIPDLKRVCETLVYLGLTADELGETKDAVDYYESALEIANNTDDSRMQRRIHGKLGILFAREGDARRATEHFTQANNAVRKSRWKMVYVNEEDGSSSAAGALDERVGKTTKVTQVPKPSPLAALSTEISQRNRSKVIDQGILLFVGIVCVALLIFLNKGIFPSGSISVFVGVAVIAFLVVFYLSTHRFK